MTEFEPTPPRNTATIATVTAAVAALATALSYPPAAGIAAPGVLALAYGAFTGSRTSVTAGASVVFLAALFAALAGTSVFAVLLAGTLSAAAYDLADNGVSLGEQVGADARTRHGELVHAALTFAVAGLTVTIAFLIYLVGADQRPVAAIVLLAAGALALFAVLRPD